MIILSASIMFSINQLDIDRPITAPVFWVALSLSTKVRFVGKFFTFEVVKRFSIKTFLVELEFFLGHCVEFSLIICCTSSVFPVSGLLYYISVFPVNGLLYCISVFPVCSLLYYIFQCLC